MNRSLDELLKRARNVRMSKQDSEAQRQSFAFGSAAIENEEITRETVRTAAEELAARSKRVIQVSSDDTDSGASNPRSPR